MFPRSASFALGCLALALAARPAIAATATTAFGVSVMVQATCLATASPIGFGTFNGGALSADTSVSVNCTNPTPYSVGLSAGVSPEATLSARQMIAPSSALLRYVLASGSQGLSLGRAMGSDTVSGAGNGSAQVPSSSSLIPIRQLVAPGAYSDTITITVTY